MRYDCLPTQNHKGSSGKATAFITMKKNWHASFKIKGGGKYWMFWVCCFVGLPECPQHHLPLLGLGHMVSTQNHLGLVLHKVVDPAAKLQYCNHTWYRLTGLFRMICTAQASILIGSRTPLVLCRIRCKSLQAFSRLLPTRASRCKRSLAP